MLGFAVSGVALTRLRSRAFDGDLPALCASAFAITTVASTIVFYQAPIDLGGSTRTDFVRGLLQCLPLALLFAVPFAFAGLVLGALLAAPGLATGRVYSADLVGSAVGAIGVLPLLTWLGVERGLLSASALLLITLVALAPPKRWLARGGVGVAALVLTTAWAQERRAFDLRYPEGSLLAGARRGVLTIEHVIWDPISRVEVSRIPPLDWRTMSLPALVGTNQGLIARITRMITLNNFALSLASEWDGRAETLAGTEETIYASAYAARLVDGPRVFLIGVGGGFDVLTALHFGASEVVGAEVNGGTIRVLKEKLPDMFRHWVEHPRVSLHHAEGRSLLLRSQRPFDIIQLSEVDSYSGTPGAAHVFSEAHLFTAEAFDLYLSRLSPRGVFVIMSLEFDPAREVLRYLVTAVEALRRRGVSQPREHIAVVRTSGAAFVALLVKATPWTREEAQRLAGWAGASPLFDPAAGPFPELARAGTYQDFLDLDHPVRERAFALRYPFDVSPVTDDRPFAFHYSRWSHLFATAGPEARAVPVLEFSVLALGLVLALAAVLCVLLPLRWIAGGPRVSEAWRELVALAGIGIGFMCAEIAALHQFSLYLGHPNYALSIVLAALLSSSGVGSMLSARLARLLGANHRLGMALAAVLVLQSIVSRPLLDSTATSPFAVRAGIAFTLVSLPGVWLGTFLPILLQSLKASRPALVPWAWAVNGTFSVLGPVLAIAFAVTLGTRALQLATAMGYLGVGFLLPRQLE